MKLAFAFLLSLASVSAYATSACLTNVSNADLIEELSTRLGSNVPTPGGSVVLSSFCNSEYLHVKVTSLQTGQQEEKSYDLGTVNNCSAINNVVHGKSRQLVNGGQFAYCNGEYLHTITVTVGGALVESSSDLGTVNNCNANANDINK